MACVGRRTWFVGVAMAAALAGCGPSDGGGGAEVSFEEYERRLLAAFCKLEVACAEMPDEATCLATVQVQPGYVPTLQQDIDSGKIAFDGKQGAYCLSLLEGLSGCKKSQAGVAAAGALLEDGCDGLFTGSVAVGGACFFHEECASGVCAHTDPLCSISRQCCAGTCAEPPPPIPLGGDCSAALANQSCVMGSSCVPQGSAQPPVCTRPAETEGAACVGPGGCRYPLFCDIGSGSATTGTCKRPVATGTTCNPQTEQSCDDGRDSCLPDTMKCTPKAPLGAACTPETCVDYASCRNAICVPRLKPGEACDPTFGPTCLGGLPCSNLICTRAPASDLCM